MRRLLPVTLLILVTLLVAACAPGALPPIEAPTVPPAAVEQPTAIPPAAEQAVATPLPAPLTPEPTGSQLAGTEWVMASLNGNLPAANTTVTLQFGKDGSISGSDGCNRYMTTYQEDGQNLTFAQPMAGTMMACPDEPTMKQAAAYQDALAQVTGFSMSSRQLVLFAGPDIVLTFVADVQALDGTAWLVTSYNNGREAVVSPLLDTEITLNFEADQLNGNAGCNNYFAGYQTTSDGSISVETLGSTFRFCETPEGVMEQEGEYLAALQSAATFRIEGDQLWLRTAGDAIAVIAVEEPIIDLPEPAPEPQTPTGTVSGTNVLNIRSGPGTNFPIIGAARQGDTGTIVGRSQDGRWWVVDAPSLPGGRGWVSADFVIARNVENVPVIAAPPTPAPTPTRVPPTPAPTPTRVPPTSTPVPPPPQAQINFWADRTQINVGECTTLRWDVQNVQAIWVYPQGSDFNAFPRTGQGNETVCPNATTTYEMRVLLTSGETRFQLLTINVTQPPPPPVVTDPLAGTRWTVKNVNNGMGAVTSLISGTNISMEFDTGGRVQGAAGCNTYFAGYRAGGNVLSVDRPAVTSLFCPEPDGVMQQEQQFLAALQSAATFQITGNQLQIRSGSDALAIVAVRAP